MGHHLHTLLHKALGLVTSIDTRSIPSTETAVSAAIEATKRPVAEIRTILDVMLQDIPTEEQRALKLQFMNRLGNALWHNA